MGRIGRGNVRRAAAAAVALATGASMLTSCYRTSTLKRADAPQVLTGAQLPALTGFAPGTIVAFAHRHALNGGSPTWTQIPVQIDERKVVPFGRDPGANNTFASAEGTVYGNAATVHTALQYVDPLTWVGPDTNVQFDADDELVFMVGDAGDKREAADPQEPTGVVAGSGVEVALTDPLEPSAAGYVYLFRTDGTLSPGAGKDYVDYDFTLTSGNYRTTYKRGTGGNPETSKVTTSAYEIGFSDRWIEDSWKIRAIDASGVDVLDGVKDQFGITTCIRSNATFASAEGAFVANVDGPVRGIRSFVGANSGPLTQRTHLFYRDRAETITDLRVHAIPAIMDYLDFSAAAVGMTYQNQQAPNGVTLDGTLDSLPTAISTWESLNGAQGSLITTSRFQTSINPPGGFAAKIQWFNRDQVTPPEAQCWGDPSFYGAAGPWVTGGVDNTDPQLTNPKTLSATRVVRFGSPVGDPSALAASAATLANQVDTPLTVTIT